ncbi:RIP metalloprotease RseP [Candidatus Borreliella tachyglossi]|uniref:Zinc metalloprotease n=1 Tax=Candidatus Borreliella tachyglossi TaxID=1964448 RepID=A0A2S1LW68_9SPIR|nr:RIP metalloprotease RseP [Candidatus Borreliella tachyglossi]AWG42515.1 RIP metalloprotease RseP [Candidatus Borreliella tachyglossi]
MSVLFSLLGFSLIIFIHELGHFLFAKLFRVKVEVFSVGIGPSIFKFKVKGTEYRFSPIFLGGYCKLKGAEHLGNELRLGRQIEADKDSLFGISNFKKILIYFAGPLFNLILGFMFFIIIEMVGIIIFDYPSKINVTNKNSVSNFRDGDIISRVNTSDIRYFSDLKQAVPVKEVDITFTISRGSENVSFKEHTSLEKLLGEIRPWIDLVISKVESNSPAEVAGLKTNDKIIGINDVDLNNSKELNSLIINLDVDVVDIKFERNGEILTSKLLFQDANKSLGVYFLPRLERVIKADNLGIAIKNSFNKVLDVLGDILYSIFALLTNFTNNSKNIVGPVGLVNILSGSSSLGVSYWLNTVAIFNLLVAGMNLFFVVIPVFDGGQILISLIEILRGRRFKPKFIYYFYSFGIVLVLGLFILGLFNDLNNILG